MFLISGVVRLGDIQLRLIVNKLLLLFLKFGDFLFKKLKGLICPYKASGVLSGQIIVLCLKIQISGILALLKGIVFIHRLFLFLVKGFSDPFDAFGIIFATADRANRFGIIKGLRFERLPLLVEPFLLTLTLLSQMLKFSLDVPDLALFTLCEKFNPGNIFAYIRDFFIYGIQFLSRHLNLVCFIDSDSRCRIRKIAVELVFYQSPLLDVGDHFLRCLSGVQNCP